MTRIVGGQLGGLQCSIKLSCYIAPAAVSQGNLYKRRISSVSWMHLQACLKCQITSKMASADLGFLCCSTPCHFKGAF